MKTRVAKTLISVMSMISAIAIPVKHTSQSVNCKTDVDQRQLAEVKGKNPVVFAHGLLSGPGIGDALSRSIDTIRGVKAEALDYQAHNQSWVTDPEIALKLAKMIVCFGEVSKNKDVIVVAHSMGGLAAELAASMEFEGKKVSSYLKYLITIGTPWRGSELAGLATNVGTSLCQAPAAMLSPLLLTVITPERCLHGFAIKALSPQSEELAAIPPLPPTVAVKTIAGDVSTKMWTPWGEYNNDTHSDLQVPLDSAIAGHTEKFGWDGSKVFSCEGSVMIPGHSDAPCEHVGLMWMPEVHQEVKAGIEKYLAGTPPLPKKAPAPAGQSKALFGKLTITYSSSWGKGINQTGLEDAVDYSDCRGESIAECPHIIFVDLDSEAGRAYSDPRKVTFDCYLQQDENGHKPFEPPKLKGKQLIGTEYADYYEQKVCPAYLSDQTAAIWHVKNRRFLVATEGETLGHKVSLPTLKAVLENAVWM